MSDGEANLLNQSAKPDQAQARRGARAGQGEPATETVTYLPREGDPPSVKWQGLTFHANVPKQINLGSHQDLVDKAKANKHFKVGAFDPDKDSVEADVPPTPKTAEQYRAWCVAWLNKTESDHDFVNRWMSEEKLREECGVGTDDLDFLNALITPKRAELQKRAMA